ncbi:MAG TPA: GNAT family N-acetyltransferase, partial [Burkholderiaceae bacterium]|nr:GNAT family N-acetyltransferase [Burkholderiaceae bacterium]
MLHHPLCDLEPLSVDHAAAMFPVLSDPAIYEFENAPPASEAALAARYARQVVGHSPDGRERWLNWVVRRPTGELAGYVQATIHPDGSAYLGYELASRHWRQGLGSAAVATLIDELVAHQGVTRCVAVLKARNARSFGLLHTLGFQTGSAADRAAWAVEDDELILTLTSSRSSACAIDCTVRAMG